VWIQYFLLPCLCTVFAAVISLVVFILQSKYKKAEKKQRKEYEDKLAAEKKAMDDRDENREKYMVMLIQMSSASIALGEANAVALQNGKCNGETHRALEYATKVKHDNREFLTRLGVESIF
jgi:flagellar biosynthesis component FlhA